MSGGILNSLGLGSFGGGHQEIMGPPNVNALGPGYGNSLVQQGMSSHGDQFSHSKKPSKKGLVGLAIAAIGAAYLIRRGHVAEAIRTFKGGSGR